MAPRGEETEGVSSKMLDWDWIKGLDPKLLGTISNNMPIFSEDFFTKFYNVH